MLEAGFMSGGGNSSSYRESRLAAFGPAGKIGPWSLRASLDAAHIRSSDDGYFPGELYRIKADGMARMRRFVVKIGARSDSDKPFSDLNTTDLSADFACTILSSGTHTIMAGVNYSSERSFMRGMPFPYLLYSYMSGNLQFALPFFVRVKLAPGLWFKGVYIPVKNGLVALRYEQKKGYFYEFELSSRFDQYLLYRRTDPDNRLYRAVSSVLIRQGFPLGRGFMAEVSAGWAYSNYYFTGKRFSDINDRINLGAWPFAGLSVKFIPGKR